MRIGIPVADLGESIGVKRDYLWFVEDTRNTPVLIHPQSFSQEFFKLDGLLLPGGADVDYKRYIHLDKKAWSGWPDPYLEYFDRELLPKFVQAKLPIFGICRGLQTLNVFFGGTLHADISKKHPVSKDRFDYPHFVELTGTLQRGRVNSYHHQAIDLLGNDLEVVATSPSDGFVEAIRHKILPVIAVQCHPERMRDIWSMDRAMEIFK